MIIGITGTNGAGKGTVVDYLVTKGFTHYSVRSLLVEEIERRGMSVDRSSMRDVANEMRRTHSPSYAIETLYAKARAAGGDAVIESVRVIGEATFLKKRGAVILAVDADRKLRYERILARGSSTDHVDFDTWVKEEEREWANPEAWDMDVIGVMKLADATIQNNGTLEELHAHIDETLAQITR